MRAMMAFLLVFSFVAAPSTAQTRKTLEIYLIDVEGGGATLFVAPSGETVLVDTGNGGGGKSEIAARDADRILAAANDAGVKQIDHLITTHWHGDHFGAMTEVAERLPIKEFIDHGDPALLLASVGLDAPGIEEAIRARFGGLLLAPRRARSVV